MQPYNISSMSVGFHNTSLRERKNSFKSVDLPQMQLAFTSDQVDFAAGKSTQVNKDGTLARIKNRFLAVIDKLSSTRDSSRATFPLSDEVLRQSNEFLELFNNAFRTNSSVKYSQPLAEGFILSSKPLQEKNNPDSEHVAIRVSPSQDNVLAPLVADLSCNVPKNGEDSLSLVKDIAAKVREKFGDNSTALLDRQTYKYVKNKEHKPTDYLSWRFASFPINPVDLGEVVENPALFKKVRETSLLQSLAVKSIGDAIGVKTSLVMGSSEKGCHCWNELEFEDGNKYILDPQNNLIADIASLTAYKLNPETLEFSKSRALKTFDSILSFYEEYANVSYR